MASGEFAKRYAASRQDQPPVTNRPAPLVEEQADIEIVVSIDDNWQIYANCYGMNGAEFYPPYAGSARNAKPESKDEQSDREERAKAICRNCLVREVCQEYALVNREDDGIWGGMTERERRRILKQRSSRN